MTSFFYVASIAYHTSVPALQTCMDTSRKKYFGWERSHSCTACFHRTSKSCLTSPLWAVQRHESHWGRGLVSTADVEDTRRTIFRWFIPVVCAQQYQVEI